MVKHIIFDLGGVVVPDSTSQIRKEVAQILNLDQELLNNKFDKLLPEAFSGKLSLYELYETLTAELGCGVEVKTVFDKHIQVYTYRYEFDALMKKLISNLKHNYIISCLSNTEIEIMEINRKLGLYSIFDNVYLSPELGMKKPDRTIYETVLRKLKALPEEVIFIDDNSHNVDCANKLGMQSIHFTGHSECYNSLQRLINI